MPFDEKILRKGKIAIGLIVIVLGVCVEFFDPICSVYCSITGTPQSWVKKSSSLRGPIKDVWAQWKRDDLSRTAAVEEISAIVRDELPEGSSDADVREHIKKHFEKPQLQSMGAQPARQYRQDAHGYSTGDETWILNVRYFTRHGEFLYADLHMNRGKGGDLRCVYLTPKVDLWPSVPPPGKADKQ